MTPKLNRYQEIILKDVQNPKYLKQCTSVWWVFGFFAVIFLLFYVFFFHHHLPFYWEFASQMYLASLDSWDLSFRRAVYLYQHIILFTAFLGVVGVFGVLAFLAYDMQARNQVIRSLVLAKEELPFNANASEETKA